MKTKLKDLNPEIKKAIDTNNAEFFGDKNLCEKEKCDILHNAVSLGKDKIITYLYDSNVVAFDTVLYQCLGNLITKKGKIKALQALEDKGFVFHLKAPLLLSNAVFDNNAPYSEFLCSKIEDKNHEYYYLTLINILQQRVLKQNNFTLEDIKDSIAPMLRKASPELMERVYSYLESQPPAHTAFLRNEYLSHTLSADNKPEKKMKL